MEFAAEAAAQTSAAHPFGGMVIGGLIGFVLGLLILAALAWGPHGTLVVRRLARRTGIPMVAALLSLGLWLGFVLTTPEDVEVWHLHVAHTLLILTITMAGWYVYAGLGLLGDKQILTDVRSGRDARRFRTQAQILRRASQSLTVILTLVFILLTFPEARAPMASILASAGLVSVIAGLAAQTTLGNMFAGLQLAFTDALRVGDNIVVPGEDQPGRVEEITLTYVVVRIWDERRVILPSSEFTTKGFENWTRKSASQLSGFSVQVDWTAPVAEIRAEVQRLLETTDLWDRRTWSVQVYDLIGPYMTLRVVVSGDNWARLQDLRSYLRENLVSWIRINAPWAMPRQRNITSQGPQIRPVMPTDALDPEMLSDPDFTGPAGGGEVTKYELFRPDPDAPYEEEEPKPKKKRRKKKSREIGAPPAQSAGSSLFHGTPDNEDRASLYDGPGQQTLWHRALRTFQRNKDVESIPVSGKFDDDVVEQAKAALAGDGTGEDAGGASAAAPSPVAAGAMTDPDMRLAEVARDAVVPADPGDDEDGGATEPTGEPDEDEGENVGHAASTPPPPTNVEPDENRDPGSRTSS